MLKYHGGWKKQIAEKQMQYDIIKCSLKAYEAILYFAHAMHTVHSKSPREVSGTDKDPIQGTGYFLGKEVMGKIQ